MEVISFHFHMQSLSAREQPELPGRDGWLGGSNLKDACRRRVVEAGPRDLDLLQLTERLRTKVVDDVLVGRVGRVRPELPAKPKPTKEGSE